MAFKRAWRKGGGMYFTSIYGAKVPTATTWPSAPGVALDVALCAGVKSIH